MCALQVVPNMLQLIFLWHAFMNFYQVCTVDMQTISKIYYRQYRLEAQQQYYSLSGFLYIQIGSWQLIGIERNTYVRQPRRTARACEPTVHWIVTVLAVIFKSHRTLTRQPTLTNLKDKSGREKVKGRIYIVGCCCEHLTLRQTEPWK